MTFSIFDLIVFAIITVSSLLGLYRGFIYITLHLTGFVCSILLAVFLYPFAKDILGSYISNDLGLSIVSGASVYIISLIICTLLTSKIVSLCDGGNKSIFNRSFGLLIGFLRGLLLATIIFVIVILATNDAAEMEDPGEPRNYLVAPKYPKWLADSETTIYLQKVVKYIISVLPEDIVKSIKLPGSDESKFKEEDAIDAINRRKKNDVKSVIEIPTDRDLKNSIEEVIP
jgi:membrane protein required for colicin V production